ncbi:MAG: hypothetical protein LC808_16435 [Actinobacteria bacterium]|nr:hypothetical protein [Actinomycetota bacterium]
MISPRTAIAPEAVAAAESHVHLVHPDVIQLLLSAAMAAWQDLLNRSAGHTGNDLQLLVRRIFGDHQVLPSQVRERLTEVPVAG